MVLIKAFRKEDTIMEKTIKISDKEFKMKSSAYTQFAYKNETGRGLMNDLQELTKLDMDNLDNNLEVIDTLNNMVLRMAYVMIKEADKNQVGGFEDFLKGLDNLYTNTEWINETIELAISPLSRG